MTEPRPTVCRCTAEDLPFTPNHLLQSIRETRIVWTLAIWTNSTHRLCLSFQKNDLASWKTSYAVSRRAPDRTHGESMYNLLW